MPNNICSTFLPREGGVVTAVAIDMDKNSQHAVRGVVDNLENVKEQGLVLVHVRTQNNTCLPVDDKVSKEGGCQIKSEMEPLFLPYRGFCTRNNIYLEEVVLHDLDVPSALVDYIKNNYVTTIVLGASSRGALAKAFKNPDVPTTLSKMVPEFCSVYVASKDKVIILKTSTRPPPPSKDLARRLSLQSSQQTHDSYRQETCYSEASGVTTIDDGGSRMASPDHSMTSLNNVRGKNVSFHLSSNPSPQPLSAHFRISGSQPPSPGKSMTANDFNRRGSLSASPSFNKPISQLISSSKPGSRSSSPAKYMSADEFSLLMSSGPGSLTSSPRRTMAGNDYLQTFNKRGTQFTSSKLGSLSASPLKHMTANELLQTSDKRDSQLMSSRPGSQNPSPGQSMTANEFLQTCSKPGCQLVSSRPGSQHPSPGQSMTANEFLQMCNKPGSQLMPSRLGSQHPTPGQSMTANEFLQICNKPGSQLVSSRPGSQHPTPGQSMTANEFLQIYNKPGSQLVSSRPGSQHPSPRQSMTANEFLQTCNKPFSRQVSNKNQQSNNDNNQINNKNSTVQTAIESCFSVSGPPSWESSDVFPFQIDESETGDDLTTTISRASVNQDEQLMRLRLELKQTMDMYNLAQQEAIAAKMKVQEIDQWKPDEAMENEEAKIPEETTLATAQMGKQNSNVAIEASEVAARLTGLVEQKQKSEEARIQKEAEAEEKKKNSDKKIDLSDVRYRRYSIEEIETATNYFSAEMRIGEGGYGPVFKGYLDHTLAAIKVLRKDLSEGKKQFSKEIEVLSSMRHPYLVLLLGACPEYGCLAYEFLENGSLEDRLFRKDNTPPIPWKTRFKIAAEIASGLFFLHHTKPKPLVHRDLKPANILLDGNFVSKIGDVGLSRLIPASSTDGNTQYCLTAAAGTFCYIDPEYQQTGKLGTKSDLYAFGVVLLQILTAKAPMGLTYSVENAIETGTFDKILDPSINDWPVQEALSLAKLALRCCELRKKDRPSLDSVILPELERLRDI